MKKVLLSGLILFLLIGSAYVIWYHVILPRLSNVKSACYGNMLQIDGVKDHCAIEHDLKEGDHISRTELEKSIYIKRWPQCPAGGKYSVNPIGTYPECSIRSHNRDQITSVP